MLGFLHDCIICIKKGLCKKLQQACHNGNDVIVELLLKAGASISSIWFIEALGISASIRCRGTNKQYKVVKLLLQYGANPNIKTPCGEAALIWAKSFEVMQVLIEHKADVNHRCNNGMSVLDCLLSCLCRKDEDINKYMSLLIKGGCNINSQCPKGNTALHRIISQDSNMKLTKIPYVVSALFNHGADPKIRNKQGQTAFECAYSDSVKDILTGSYLRSSAVKDRALLLLGAKHANSRGIDESDTGK